jgi:hypothetical protein
MYSTSTPPMRWLGVQPILFELSEKFRADPVVL